MSTLCKKFVQGASIGARAFNNNPLNPVKAKKELAMLARGTKKYNKIMEFIKKKLFSCCCREKRK